MPINDSKQCQAPPNNSNVCQGRQQGLSRKATRQPAFEQIILDGDQQPQPQPQWIQQSSGLQLHPITHT
eukprot:2806853-Pyramimonas_sp.AAC.1